MGVPVRGFVVAAGFVWLLLASAVACGQQGAPEVREETPTPEKTLEAVPPEGVAEETPVQEKSIESVLQEHTGSLMAIVGVVGTAQGECDGEPCIKVLVVKKTPDLLKQLPSELKGYTVAVEETGEIQALDSR